jgi:hypothetical protein
MAPGALLSRKRPETSSRLLATTGERTGNVYGMAGSVYCLGHSRRASRTQDRRRGPGVPATRSCSRVQRAFAADRAAELLPDRLRRMVSTELRWQLPTNFGELNACTVKVRASIGQICRRCRQFYRTVGRHSTESGSKHRGCSLVSRRESAAPNKSRGDEARVVRAFMTLAAVLQRQQPLIELVEAR